MSKHDSPTIGEFWQMMREEQNQFEQQLMELGNDPDAAQQSHEMRDLADGVLEGFIAFIGTAASRKQAFMAWWRNAHPPVVSHDDIHGVDGIISRADNPEYPGRLPDDK